MRTGLGLFNGAKIDVAFPLRRSGPCHCQSTWAPKSIPSPILGFGTRTKFSPESFDFSFPESRIMASSRPPSSKRRRTDKGEQETTGNPPPSSPVVVFAHGAGAPSSSDWMVKWKGMLENGLGAVEVVTFDYPYIAGRKKGSPPKAEKLVEFHKDVVKNTVAKYPGHPLVLAGKSMGSRVSCMVAVEDDVSASAVICLGYPLKGMNGVLRDETLLELTVPVMFVQGSKDNFCPLEKLGAVCKKMKSQNELHVIDGGDHSFKIGKKHLQTNGSTQDEAEDLAVQAIASFISSSLQGK